jgi:hypothetical protein
MNSASAIAKLSCRWPRRGCLPTKRNTERGSKRAYSAFSARKNKGLAKKTRYVVLVITKPFPETFAMLSCSLHEAFTVNRKYFTAFSLPLEKACGSSTYGYSAN